MVVVPVVRLHRATVTQVYLHTFGCKANQYDTEVIRQALVGAGATPVQDPARADAAVVNTCAVTHVSEAKMRGLVRRLARRERISRTVVTGCAAALDRGAIARLPGVTRVLPGVDPIAVLEALGLPADGIDPVLRRFSTGSRAWLKIQDGCDEHCTFCATTRARGHSRSRSAEELVEEAEELAENHAEIVLTGVHIGAYGIDLTGRPGLGDLVELLVNVVPRVRYRLSSLEATELDERLQDLMVSLPERLAPHVHAPLQSGSDRILKRMGRHWYSASEYRRRLERLARSVPFLGLGADVMVGFPGESARDFAATRSLIESLPFTYLHVFQYSERAGTPAVAFGPAVGPRVSRLRSAQLRNLGRAKATAYRVARDGSEVDVVLLRHSQGRYEGLSEDYLPVFLRSDQQPARRFRAKVTCDDGTLWVTAIL